MKIITVSINEDELQEYGLTKDAIKFEELLDKIKMEIAKKTVKSSQEIAKTTGLSELTLEEIQAEINEVRKNAKDRN